MTFEVWEKRARPVKATSYSNIYWIKRQSEDQILVLDYTDFAQKWGEDALGKIFPKHKGCGQLYPSHEYLKKGSLVREWREMGEIQQRSIIEQEESSRLSNNAKSKQTHAEQSQSPQTKKRKSSLAADDNVKSDKSINKCIGITKHTIHISKRKDKDELEQGFYHLIGKAYRQKGQHISNSGEWMHGHSVAGFITDRKKSNFSWRCEQHNDDTNEWGFHAHGSCVGGEIVSDKKPCCQFCWENRNDFFSMCKEEFE